MIELLLNHYMSYVLADVLLHSLWQYAIIAVVLWAALAFTKQLSSNIRYAMCCLALVLIILAPVLTFSMVFSKQTSIQENIQTSEVLAETSTVPVMPNESLQLSLEEIGTVGFVNSTQQTIRQAIQKGMQKPSLKQFLPWLVIVWLIGILVLTLRLLGSWIVVDRLKTQGVSLSVPELQKKLLHLSMQLGIRKQVRLFDSTKVIVPMVVGYLRPVILLPTSTLIGLSTEQIELIIAHELAHIKRHDNLVNVIQHLVETIFFYHPAVWWISKQIRVEREHCCDDLSIKVTGSNVVDYVEMLAGLEHIRQQPQFVMAASSGGNGVLINRIRRLLVPTPTEHGNSKSWLLILCIALVITGGFWFAPKIVSAQTATETIGLEIYDAEGILLDESIASHAIQMIKDELVEKLGSSALSKDLKIYSSLNTKAQQAAYDAALTAQAQIIIRDYQLALASIDPNSGGIIALIGELPDLTRELEYRNRAVALREVGSLIKPMIYATAFEEAGFSQATILKDEPIDVLDYSGEAYPLNNHDMEFVGPATIRHHLNISRNVPPIKLLDTISADSVINNLKTLGYTNPINKVALSIFDTQASPLQVTAAYAAFANTGIYTAPYVINRVEDASGRQLFEHEQNQTRVWSAQTAYEMLDALNGNVIDLKSGSTSFSSRADISGRWVGGKTGTSKNEKDIWFTGITPGLVTTVWIGNENGQPIPKRTLRGERITSSRQPNWFWHDYTTAALSALNIASTEFPVPDGIEFTSLNLVTGKADETGILTALPVGTSLE